MKRFGIIIILLVTAFFYSRPFFHRGYFSTHDGEWAIVRLSEMVRELKDLQAPPRWSDYLNHGYGYPLFSFTYPLPYYLGAVVHATGISLTDTVKVLFVASVVLSGIFMYLLGKELMGELAGVLSALFYIASPYRLVDLYIRGSLGESVNFAVFPLLCYFSILWFKKKQKFYMILCSILLAVMILSHNATALIFFPVWILFVIVSGFYYKLDLAKTAYKFLPVIVFGLGLSAYFFVPAVLEKKYIQLSEIKLADVKDNFVSLNSLVNSSWNSGNKPSYFLGLANILGFFLGLISLIMSYKRKKESRSYLYYFLFLVPLFIYIMNQKSEILWNIVPLKWLDFPWRFLGPLTFLLALSTVFTALNKKIFWLSWGVVILAVLVNSSPVQIKEYFDKPDEYYATNDATTTSNDELMPSWVSDKPTNRYEHKVEVIYGQADISSLIYNSRKISFNLAVNTDSRIAINTLYFPGWLIILNGENISPEISEKKGIMTFNVSPGNYKVSGRFTETGVRRIADLISFLSILTLFIILVFDRVKNFYHEK